MGGNLEIAYNLGEYDYALPPELIAQAPMERRESSRLLVLDRGSSLLAHHGFEGILRYLEPGDLMVLNDTRVVPARLMGSKETGGQVELLVLDPYKDPGLGSKEGYVCLVKASKGLRAGSVVSLRGGARAEVLSSAVDGKARVRFEGPDELLQLLGRIGEIPLPPYIRRNGAEPPCDDISSYQTVYACNPGAVAAPTAGLHFSRSLLDEIFAMSIELVKVTLHVGYGTFSPLRVEDIRLHRMHAEHAEVSEEAAGRIRAAKEQGRRIVAVGTTVVRILEWVARESGEVVPFRGPCEHYIYPGYRFSVVDGMITNFHLPKSSLLLLVSAFAGREAILDAYAEAVRKEYRFFSYGDAMLIL
jgi:S-adenosylmethionine:tRNA ribosyltransferase-isomerase